MEPEATIVIRTSLFITHELKHRAEQAARIKGVTLSQYLRNALEMALKHERQCPDPLFVDTAVFEGKVPADMSENHDHYLYNDETGGRG